MWSFCYILQLMRRQFQDQYRIFCYAFYTVEQRQPHISGHYCIGVMLLHHIVNNICGSALTLSPCYTYCLASKNSQKHICLRRHLILRNIRSKIKHWYTRRFQYYIIFVGSSQILFSYIEAQTTICQ